MKKVFTILTLLTAMAFTANAQQNFYIDVWSNPSTGAPVTNYPVHITIHSNPPIYISGMTNSSGRYLDSIPSTPAGTLMEAYTFDCNGNYVHGISTIKSAPYYSGDTLILSCQAPGGYLCNVSFQDTSAGNNLIHFMGLPSQGYYTNSAQNVELTWNFGDGNSATGLNTSHTYASPGRYLVTATITVYDSLIPGSANQRVICSSSFSDSVIVPGNPTANFCTAAFDVDTSASGNGTVYIWNNSTAGANANIVFQEWDFGDGNTSYNAYPTHSYSTHGSFNVCLTITAYDGVDTCISTYCEILNVDSSGNLFKNGAGFSLVVLDPATSDLEESNSGRTAIYPNPANATEGFNVELPMTSNDWVQWTIYDLRGSALLSGSADTDADNKFIVNPKNVGTGMYLLMLQYNEQSTHHSIQLQ